MTKRNLFLSLFLVLGLALVVPSAMATTWNAGSNVATHGRAEGFSEATGQVAVSLVNGGSVSAGSAFVINFSQPVVDLGSVYVVCNGIGSSPFASGCQNILSVSWSTTPPGIQLTFNSTQAFTSDDQSEIVLTARVNVTSLLPAGGTVWASVTAETPATGALVSLGGANPVTGLEVLLVQTNSIYLDGLALTTF